MASDQSWNKAAADATSLRSSDPPPCANGCGFFGSAASMNLCSKCYRDVQASANLQKPLTPKSIPAGSSGESVGLPLPLPGAASASSACDASDVASCGDEAPEKPSRCGTCKKRVGLTGFECRCGMTFCGVHRYPEKHECSFDFKGAGREAISRANPLIKADKVVNRI